MLLKLAFSAPLAYCTNEGLRTPTKAMPFNAFSDSKNPKIKMVRLRGFEPPPEKDQTATSTLRVYQFRHSRIKI